MKAFKLLCLGRAACCIGTMAFAGVLPVIRNEWDMDASSAGAIQTTFNISNALALFAASWLSDYYGSRRIYLIFSWLGGFALLAFGFFAHSFSSALLLISFVGLTQGGAYTPAIMLGMRMNSALKRGYAVGMILASGSLGYLLSLLLASWSATKWGAANAFYLCAVCVLMGAALSSFSLKCVIDPPAMDKPKYNKPGTRGKHWGIFSLLLLLGYVAHCWELLGSWAWTPSLLYTALSQFNTSALLNGMVIAGVIHLSGILSTLIVGTISDYFNRTVVLIVMGGAGALCSVITGWSVTWGGGWVFLCAAIGSFFILGDSGVLSAAIADNVHPQILGRVMGIRSLLGFGIGSFSSFGFGIVLDKTGNWIMAYSVLASGGGIAFLAAIIISILNYGRKNKS